MSRPRRTGEAEKGGKGEQLDRSPHSPIPPLSHSPGGARHVHRAVLAGLTHVTLIAGSGIMLIPFFWMVSTSLKVPEQVLVQPIKWIPDPVVWSNYGKALTVLPFGLYLKNTVVITALVMVGTILSSAACAYGFARLKAPGRDLLFLVMLSTMMLPGIVTMIPTFLLFRWLGWIDTIKPLTVPAFFGSAFFIFLLRQFFLTIPAELEDAARIDGATSMDIFARIMLPLAKPALATVAIFTFMGTWNDFMGPLIYLNSEDKFTLSLGLASFQGLYGTEWHYMMAASLVVMSPIIVLFFIGQRYFVKGIITTGIKG